MKLDKWKCTERYDHARNSLEFLIWFGLVFLGMEEINILLCERKLIFFGMEKIKSFLLNI